MRKCAICGQPIEAGAVVHTECLPRWIPVEERLPEPLTDVLVWIENKGSGERYASKTFYLSFPEKWAWGDQYITHWMPMPVGPTEVRDEKAN